MSGVLCTECEGYFATAEHLCGAILAKEVAQLQDTLMARDTHPDYERGELDGQDAMLRHVALLDDRSNSLLAAAVKKCTYVQGPLGVLAELADKLEAAGYALEQPFDPEAAKAFHFEFGILQKRCELFAKDFIREEG